MTEIETVREGAQAAHSSLALLELVGRLTNRLTSEEAEQLAAARKISQRLSAAA